MMTSISLSERFKLTKPVTTDSTESDTEISDDEFFPSLSKNLFHYSNPSPIIFRESRENLTEELNCSTEEDELDAECNSFEMIPAWREHFENILKKCKGMNVEDVDHRHTSVFDRIPKTGPDLPLQCLKTSLKKYKESQGHSFEDSDDILMERGDPEFVEVNACKEAGKTILKDSEISVTEASAEYAEEYKEKIPGSVSIETNKSFAEIKINNNMKGSDKHDKGLLEENEEGVDFMNEDVPSKSIKKTEIAKTKQSQAKQMYKKNTVTAKLQCQVEEAAEESAAKCDIHIEGQNSVKTGIKDQVIHESLLVQQKEVPVGQSDTGLSYSDSLSDLANSDLSERLERESNTCISEVKLDSSKFIKNITVMPKADKEKKLQGTPQFNLKETRITKTYLIKPSSVFPLDELLPPSKAQRSESGIKDQSKDLNEQKEKATVTKEPVMEVTPHSQYGSSIFHGTVYDGCEEITPCLTPQQSIQSEFTPTFQGEMSSYPFNTEIQCDAAMASILSAVQSGNREVLSLFQAALQDQISSGLAALASRSRELQSAGTTRINQKPCGFYSERSETLKEAPDEMGDSENSERLDDLMDLLVQQCSALVKTEEDKAKFRILLDFFQQEGGVKPKDDSTLQNRMEQKVTEDEHLQELPPNVRDISAQMDTKNNAEHFEGRTLLKGGVEPRHIPKTTVSKFQPGKEQPKDPRNIPFSTKIKNQFQLPLPNFAVELYGDKKVKKMLHLDWDAHFSQQEFRPSVSKAKEPQFDCTNINTVNLSKLKEIADAAKEVLSKLQGSVKSESVHLGEICRTDKSDSVIVSEHPVKPVESEQTSENVILSSDTSTSSEQRHPEPSRIPVLISLHKDQKVETADQNRQPVRLSIGLENENTLCRSLERPQFERSESLFKPVDLVKPTKTTKPSIGIVKPIQSHSPASFSVQPVAMDLDNDVENKDIELNLPVCKLKKVESCSVFQNRSSPENVIHRNKVPSSGIDIDAQDDRIGKKVPSFSETRSDIEKKIQFKKNDLEKRQHKHRNYRHHERSPSGSSVDSRYSHNSRVSLTSQCAKYSDDRGRERKRSKRNSERSQDRSRDTIGYSDRRSDRKVEGAVQSKSDDKCRTDYSRSRNRINIDMYDREYSERRPNKYSSRYEETSGSQHTDNSGRGGRHMSESGCRIRKYSETNSPDFSFSEGRRSGYIEIRNDLYDKWSVCEERPKSREASDSDSRSRPGTGERQRHQTARDSTEDRYENADGRSADVKRPHSIGDVPRKRQRVESKHESARPEPFTSQKRRHFSGREVETFRSDDIETQSVMNCHLVERFEISEVEILDTSLTDEEISNEFHQRFGRNATASRPQAPLLSEDRSKKLAEATCSNRGSVKNDQFSAPTDHGQPLPKIKDYDADKAFLEAYRNKVLNTSRQSAKNVKSQSCKVANRSSQSVETSKSKFEKLTKSKGVSDGNSSTERGVLLYSDMLNLAELEEGEILK